ncbi:ribosome small subunit-dependent GTPase A [Actinomycetospora lutea]|uniref:ribosome small subunit-dependent GTPase A n=1 Tax=Actinomycetospora lutea TaxID=663604 RepID=UPI002365804E|nr:ribosome small subunit-dependent GTPase A [Actinomycetospora lutea]MDD7937780.1 ribosome small subunit-dependent GTPase A [Actinomycetospora lutea]
MFSALPHDSVLPSYGWDTSWEQLASTLDASGVPGRVARVDRGRVDVLTDAGRVHAASRGACAVGDWVLVDDGAVTAVLPRRTTLARAATSGRSEAQVLAANVDTVLVTVPAGSTDRVGRVERLVALAWESGATPVLVVTKTDRSGDVAGVLADLALSAPGVEVVGASAVTGEGVDDVAAAARGTTVLVGPSGAGKSTLANALLGEDRLAVGDVRAVDGKGRHTTVHRELLPLPRGGRTQRSAAAAPEAGHSVLVDTPGLRAVGVRDAAEGIERAFADVVDLADGCRFADCAHDREPGCAVRTAVDAGELPGRRWEDYRKLQREDEWAAARTDARLAAERRGRWKQITKDQRARYRSRGR